MLAKEVTDAVRALDPPQSLFEAGDVAATLSDVLAHLDHGAALQQSPPFCFDPCASAETTGAEMASAYTGYAQRVGPSLVVILAAAFDRLGIQPGMAERQAAMVTAVLASVPTPNAFHNADHTREVVANLVWLLQANQHLANTGVPGSSHLDITTAARLLLAATIHDIGHDGATNEVTAPFGSTYVPFRLEDLAFDLVRPVLHRAGLSKDANHQVLLLIRATDPVLRPVVRSYTDHVLFQGPAPSDDAHDLVRELSAMSLAAAAALLCDADVLSSAGLTPEYHRHLSRLLAAERGTSFNRADSLGFFTNIVGGSFASAAGKLLDQNLSHIRATIIEGS